MAGLAISAAKNNSLINNNTNNKYRKPNLHEFNMELVCKSVFKRESKLCEPVRKKNIVKFKLR